MKINKLTLSSVNYPEILKTIPGPPKKLYYRGQLAELCRRPCVAIVGSRAITPYGKQVTERLSSELAGQGVAIISGLALGVDGVAHTAALASGGFTAAILPCPLDTIVPSTHYQLAQEILKHGGVLISEYASGETVYKTGFVARNRLVAGLADAVLITEATENSGSLHTARFAVQQGKPVLAVPGNITSPASAGTNALLGKGAVPVTSYLDVLAAIGLEAHQTPVDSIRATNQGEAVILDLLLQGVNDGERLLKQSGMAIDQFNQTVTMLEIRSAVRYQPGNKWFIL